jgi:nitrite reductase (NO-forming)
MQPLEVGRNRARPVDRSADRRVAMTAIAASITFLAAALASLVLPTASRRDLWLPIHLALAGGASTAIAGVMPFFVAAFAAAQPADLRIRIAGLAGVIVGATAVAVGVTVAPQGWIAPVGGVTFIAGIVATGLATLQPLLRALGPSRGVATQAYLFALGTVSLGAVLATLMLAGWGPVVEAWDRLRPAHAWLNLVGFVSLVTATTLLHFFPTVVGARIPRDRSAYVTVVGLGSGSLIVATGYWLAIDLVVRLGAVAAIAGALGLVVYAVRVWRRRARWTTDPGWHRFAMGGLASAITWFAIGAVILGARTVASGSSPAGWSAGPVTAPLVGGWIGLAILASATHLVPAVGPGDQAAHARQRVILGSLPVARLVGLDLGVAAMTLGSALGDSRWVIAGGALLGLGLVGTAVLLAASIAIGLRPRTSAPT